MCNFANDMKKEVKKIIRSTDIFVGEIRSIIDKARSTAVRSVDFCRVQMYWNIGKRIFEEEQRGKERADYGAYFIKNLAKKLEPEYGSGFGERQLKFFRQFYRTLPHWEHTAYIIELESISVANSDNRSR